jgi:hypothetical protein
MFTTLHAEWDGDEHLLFNIFPRTCTSAIIIANKTTVKQRKETLVVSGARLLCGACSTRSIQSILVKNKSTVLDKHRSDRQRDNDSHKLCSFISDFVIELDRINFSSSLSRVKMGNYTRCYYSRRHFSCFT